MNGSEHEHIFTSESVSEGHPDKVADRISDAILDACLKQDRACRVACETMCGHNVVVNMGEITCHNLSLVPIEQIARRVVKAIGYDCPSEGFDFRTFKYISHIHGQSQDIARGVDRKIKDKQGAGDQGMVFGYATNETKSLMPAPLVFAHELLRRFAHIRHSRQLTWLRPDGKSQISIRYRNGIPVDIDTVLVSHQTTEAAANKKHYDIIEKVARDFLKTTGMLTPNTKFLVNPTGKFVIGGPSCDSGLTGRKIIVDTYGGMAAHGGGAFSGKDPSKVDRSAAYYARYAAKNIVAAGLAARCQIQVAYAIGVDKPVSYCVKTFGTCNQKLGITDERLEEMLMSGKIFDFRPYSLISHLRLLYPRGWTYEDTAAYGHFGRIEFPWEKLDKPQVLKKYFSKK